MFKVILRVLSTGALAAAVFAIYSMPAGAATTLSNTAVISSPGNGDFAGFEIVVESSGQTWALDGAGRSTGQLPLGVAQAFFTDLGAAAPLSRLPARACSSAPGLATINEAAITLSWNGQRSPTLNCVADARAAKLLADALMIQRALYVQSYRTRAMALGGDGAALTGYNARVIQPGAALNSRFDAGGRFNNGGRFEAGRFTNGRFDGQRFTNTRFESSRLIGTKFDAGGRFTNGKLDTGGSFGSGGFGVH